MNRDIARGIQYPFSGHKPVDRADAVALGVLHDLCDRRDIKDPLLNLPPEIRLVLATEMAVIIREGMEMPWPIEQTAQ
jgi:hypothetical protein